MKTPVLILRAVQLGISLKELDEIDEGLLLDMLTESANDKEDYAQVPTQAQMDRF